MSRAAGLAYALAYALAVCGVFHVTVVPWLRETFAVVSVAVGGAP